MIISRPDVQRVEPLGPVYLSRRLTVVPRGAKRRDSLLRVLYFLLVAAAVLIPWIAARWLA